MDIAKEIGKRKQAVFKAMKRLGIEQEKAPGEGSRGQLVSYVSRADYELLLKELQPSFTDDAGVQVEATRGVFYLIQLEPEHDPGRFKVGFASNIDERLRSHRTAAPLSQVLRTWPCKLLWEKTAIESVARGCEQLHTEVFRTDDLTEVASRADAFFALMPELQQ